MNLKNLLYLSLFLLFLSCNQNKKTTTITTVENDSIVTYLKVADTDSLPFEKKFSAAKKAFDLIIKQKNDSLNRIYLLKAANRFYNINSFEESKKTTLLALKRCKEANDSINLAKSYYFLGDCYSKNFISDSAYLYYFRAEKIYREFKDISKLTTLHLNKSLIQSSKKDYIGCEKSLLNALILLREIEDNDLKYDAYNLLGILYGELKEYELSFEFHNKAFYLNERDRSYAKYTIQKTSTLNNIGNIYESKKNYKTAVAYYKKALGLINLKIINPTNYSLILGNLAHSKFKIRDFKDLPNLYYESLKIKENLRNYKGMISTKLDLSEYYAYKKDNIKAITSAIDGYKIAKKNNFQGDVLLSLKQLIEVDKKKAPFYAKEYIKINDSLQIAERKIRNKFARIEYETEELAIEKNKLVDQRNNLLFLGLGIVIVALMVFMVRFQITKNKELQFVQSQQKANEQIYTLMIDQHQKLEEGKKIEKKRISRELHDGVMGKLTSIRLNLFILSKKTDIETITKCLNHISEIQEVEKEIRTIAYDLGKNIFDNSINFTTIVKNLFTAIENHSDIAFELQTDEKIDWEAINNSIKIQLYRILQEALQNIDKYAEAKKVNITMQKSNNQIMMCITDDGIGFDEQKIKKGLGLKSMRERAESIKSKIQIDSQVGKGTQIHLAIPV